MLNKLEIYKDDLYEEEKAKSSIYNYYHHVKIFLSTIIHNEDIAKRDIMNFKKYMSDVLEFNAKTINAYIVSVNKFLYYCNLGDLKVKKLKVQQDSVLEEILSVGDYKRLYSYSNDETRLIMKILTLTGVRCEELKFFTIENIKKSTYLNIRNKGKTRTIIVRQDLRLEILKYCKEKKIESGFVFPSPKDKSKHLHRTTIFRRFKAAAGKSKVKLSLVYPHAFRHLFAKLYLEAGGNPLNLADILGHTSLETTKIYTKSTQQQLRGTLEEIKL